MTDQSNSPKPPSRRKPIFDAVRRFLGRGFRQSEVEALDDALDASFDPGFGLDNSAGTPAKTLPQDRVTSGPSLSSPPSPSVPKVKRKKAKGPRTIGRDGIALIKRFEGCAKLKRNGLVAAYPDPGTGGEPWTIGWGATGADDQTGESLGARIGPATVWTQAQCDARLESDLKRYAADVAKAIGSAATTQSQFDAMVSFHYNTGAIARATLTKKHIAGDHDGATAEFGRWNKAGGRVLKGLVRRRAAEAKLYATND